MSRRPRRRCRRPRTSPSGFARCRSAAGRRRASSSTDTQLGCQRDLALQGRVRPLGAGHRQGDRRREGHPDGAVLLSDLLGLDTVLHVAEHLQKSYGRAVLRLTRDARARRGRQPGAEVRQRVLRTRFRLRGADDGAGNSNTDRERRRALQLKAFLEACLVLEEGVASLKDIEIGMMTGAGILPGPSARADEQWTTRWQRSSAPSSSGASRSRRLPSCAGWRAGPPRQEVRRGFFPYPQPDLGVRAEGDRAARDASPCRPSGSTGRRRTR